MKNISTPRFCIANIRADGEKAESARHLNRARQRKQGKERKQSEAAEQGKEQNRARQRKQGKAAEAPHGQGRTKKSLKPDWEEAGAGTAAEAYPKQYNHDNDK